MGNWIIYGTDWFNLDDFCRIWIQTRYFHEKDTRAYYLMGEWKHNSEEVAISPDWDSVEDLIAYVNLNLGVAWAVNSSQNPSNKPLNSVNLT